MEPTTDAGRARKRGHQETRAWTLVRYFVKNGIDHLTVREYEQWRWDMVAEEIGLNTPVSPETQGLARGLLTPGPGQTKESH